MLAKQVVRIGSSHPAGMQRTEAGGGRRTTDVPDMDTIGMDAAGIDSGQAG
jgi:hypothetical protein